MEQLRRIYEKVVVENAKNGGDNKEDLIILSLVIMRLHIMPIKAIICRCSK